MELEWITPQQAAGKWGISARRVEALCANNQIDSVRRIGRMWLIPIDAPKPPDGRTKAAKQEKAKELQRGTD
ncbi:MAG: helix-turn-helix domain-containing protein [Clostridiales Family XIII bacterium]|jgi:hypothetical protein|nr:helix-turn-helix domain-containing protein [Clostridiales Family XIII bacterium]